MRCGRCGPRCRGRGCASRPPRLLPPPSPAPLRVTLPPCLSSCRSHLCSDGLPVEILGRLRSDRVMRRPTPSRKEFHLANPKGGRPPLGLARWNSLREGVGRRITRSERSRPRISTGRPSEHR
ncbi:hypothetical protein EF908_10625 [Streptomyces sp. WAC04770]|nr:hypothetical protein EF908_10625 [Streptomyces sp. WAC04770]